MSSQNPTRDKQIPNLSWSQVLLQLSQENSSPLTPMVSFCPQPFKYYTLPSRSSNPAAYDLLVTPSPHSHLLINSFFCGKAQGEFSFSKVLFLLELPGHLPCQQKPHCERIRKKEEKKKKNREGHLTKEGLELEIKMGSHVVLVSSYLV